MCKKIDEETKNYPHKTRKIQLFFVSQKIFKEHHDNAI